MIDLGLFLLAAASLAFEVDLTRLFSVAQFHHFAFLVVSLALLGYGASGTVLAAFPQLGRRKPRQLLTTLGWGFAATAIGSYLITIYVPLDTFRIVRDWRQVLVLAMHYLALSSPFLCAGMATGLALAARPDRTSRTYAASLIGSASGCGVAVVAPSVLGGEGTVLVCAALAIFAAMCFAAGSLPKRRSTALVATHLAVAGAIVAVALWLPPALEIRLSPYKSLSYALLYPDSELVSQRWNGFSRVDVVQSSSIRSLPGGGFRCEHQPPSQLGLTVDGDSLVPITHVAQDFGEQPFTDCLLTALPFRLRPDAKALVLESRAGFDVIVALSEGAASVTATEPNPLIIDAVNSAGTWAGNLYSDRRVRVVADEGRAYARQTGERFDVIVLSLDDAYRPVTSGAYSLAEDYRYTLEAFRDYYALLRNGGVLAIPRWLQVPPSEELRAFAIAVEAVDRSGGDPRTSIVAVRSYQQMLILVRAGPFTNDELAAIREFASERAFDLVHLPDLQVDEANQYNVLATPDYYYAVRGLLESQNRPAWYESYPYRVDPPTDNRPFFAHYFRWRQTRDVLALAGHVWQPFGGAGYFVLLVLLALAVLAAGALIALPLLLRSRVRQPRGAIAPTLAYFGLLGLGYLLVEIPLLQQFILYLSHPAYAVATVLFTVLFFSGIGSLLSPRLPWAVLLALSAVLVCYSLLLPRVAGPVLSAPLWARVALAVAALAPVGILMGVPFPKGLSLLAGEGSGLAPWVWGVNGATSVVASILAALLAFDLGFSAVMVLGALCYAGAWIMVRARHRADPLSPRL